MPQNFTKIYIDHKFVPGREIRKNIDMIEGLPPKWERPKAPVQIIIYNTQQQQAPCRSPGRTPSGREPEKNHLDELKGENYISK